MSQPYFTVAVPAMDVAINGCVVYPDGHRGIRTELRIDGHLAGQLYIDARTPDDLNALAARLATIAGEWLDELAADDIDTEATSGPVRVSADDLDMARTVLESSPGIARRRQWVTP